MVIDCVRETLSRVGFTRGNIRILFAHNFDNFAMRCPTLDLPIDFLLLHRCHRPTPRHGLRAGSRLR